MKLSLSPHEKALLRAAKISVCQLAELTGTQLSKCTHIPLQRCNHLVALCQFQSLGSVGVKMAEKIWNLGYTSLQTLAKANPVRMYQDYNRLTRCQADPCVEDVFRCAIAQAKHKNLNGEQRQWWYWTPMRGEAAITIPELQTC
jgi:hypothetical protein